MNNTIKMLLLSAVAGGVLMLSAGVNAEVKADTNNVIATQDAGIQQDGPLAQDAAGLNLNDEASDNFWGGWGGGWGGWGGWGYGGFGGCLGYSYWPYYIGGWYGGFGCGGCGGWGGWGGWGWGW